MMRSLRRLGMGVFAVTVVGSAWAGCQIAANDWAEGSDGGESDLVSANIPVKPQSGSCDPAKGDIECNNGLKGLGVICTTVSSKSYQITIVGQDGKSDKVTIPEVAKSSCTDGCNDDSDCPQDWRCNNVGDDSQKKLQLKPNRPRFQCVPKANFEGDVLREDGSGWEPVYPPLSTPCEPGGDGDKFCSGAAHSLASSGRLCSVNSKKCVVGCHNKSDCPTDGGDNNIRCDNGDAVGTSSEKPSWKPTYRCVSMKALWETCEEQEECNGGLRGIQRICIATSDTKDKKACLEGCSVDLDCPEEKSKCDFGSAESIKKAGIGNKVGQCVKPPQEQFFPVGDCKSQGGNVPFVYQGPGSRQAYDSGNCQPTGGGTPRDRCPSSGQGHYGVDLTPVNVPDCGYDIYAFMDGTVTIAGGSGLNLIEIQHKDGLASRYLHSSSVLVTEGQKITGGSTIAYMGGVGADGVTHLHFELYKNSASIDPSPYIFAGASSANGKWEPKRNASHAWTMSPDIVAKVPVHGEGCGLDIPNRCGG